MKGIDTNVLLSWLFDEQSSVLSGGSVYRINSIVAAELVWVLDRSFRWTRGDIADVISRLLETSEITFADPNVVAAALNDYRDGAADFADYLLARENLAADCETTLTLDRKAAKHPLFALARNT